MKKHSHYFKDVKDLETIDVYAVCKLFEIDDPSGALHHAIKKILVPGKRGAGKDKVKDIKEAIDSLQRWVELNGSLSASKVVTANQIMDVIRHNPFPFDVPTGFDGKWLFPEYIAGVKKSPDVMSGKLVTVGGMKYTKVPDIPSEVGAEKEGYCDTVEHITEAQMRGFKHIHITEKLYAELLKEMENSL